MRLLDEMRQAERLVSAAVREKLAVRVYSPEEIAAMAPSLLPPGRKPALVLPFPPDSMPRRRQGVRHSEV